MITWIGVEEEKYKYNKQQENINLPEGKRKMSLMPLGIIKIKAKKYSIERGVTTLPSVGDHVNIPTKEQLTAIIKAGGGDEHAINIGTSPYAEDVNISVDPDKLFGRNLAVLGNTGSGKSCTIAGIIRWSYEAAKEEIEELHKKDKKGLGEKYGDIKERVERYYGQGKKRLKERYTAAKEQMGKRHQEAKEPNMTFVIFDYNGEYEEAFNKRSDINYVVLDTNKEDKTSNTSGNRQQLEVPYMLWNFEEWRHLLRPSEQIQEPKLLKVLTKLNPGLKEPDRFGEKDNFKLSAVKKDVGDSNLERRIEAYERDQDLKRIAEGNQGLDKYWLPKTSEENNKQVIIIDLSSIESEQVVHMVVSIMLRKIFEEHKRRKIKDRTLLQTILIFEEAHRFLSHDFDFDKSDKEFSLSRLCLNSCSNISREGRKFGLNLVISSQMPRGLSTKVLSQCNTFLLHRIMGEYDQEHMKKLIPDRIRNLVQELPGLPTGHAYLLGWAIKIPTLVRIRHLHGDFQPDSRDPPIWNRWIRQQETD